LIEADLHQLYGIDLDDRELLRARTWRWLRVRILGLMETRESRLYRTLFPQQTAEPEEEEHLWRSS